MVCSRGFRLSKVKTSGDEGFNKSKFSPSVAVGYKLGNTRFALDYTRYGKLSYSELGSSNVPNATNSSQPLTLTGVDNFALKVNLVGFSAIYDIDLNASVVPYVGARLSYNTFKFDRIFYATNGAQSYTDSVSVKDHKLGYGVVAGVSYAFTKNIALNAGLEYNRLGQFNDVKVNQYGAKVGIRYEF